MRYPPLTGMTPILPTLVKEDGTPDLEAQGRVVDYLLQCGAVAIGHMGGASEYMKVSEYDRAAYLDALIQQVGGRAKVFIGVTDIARRTMLRRAEYAQKIGADMIMCCSPVGVRFSRNDMLQLYEELGRAVTLPLIVQDVGDSAPVFTADMILEVIGRVPTVGYVKSEGIDFYPKACQLLHDAGDTVQVIGGSAGYAMPSLLRLGIRAFMTGTECLDVHADVVNAHLRGEIDRAETLYENTMLPYLYFYNQNWPYYLKYMLMRRGVLPAVRPNFPEEITPSPALTAELDRVLERINRYRGLNIL